jgi:hypothetical protein
LINPFGSKVSFAGIIGLACGYRDGVSDLRLVGGLAGLAGGLEGISKSTN